MKPALRTAAAALYASCGDLVVSFGIEEISRVVLGDGLAWSIVDATTKLHSLGLHGRSLPAWDLGHLLGLRKGSSANVWIVIAASVAGQPRTFALACDRSLAVRPQQLHLPLPPHLFSSRPGAVVGAFATSAIQQADPLAPTGVVLSAAHLLAGEELFAVQAAADQGKLAW